MSPPLPRDFLVRPLAHRALHDVRDGRPENSREAVRAAVAHGYGIEVDIQLSQDGEAMVFHDYDLGRLTAETGPVRGRTAAELGAIRLSGGSSGIPTLREVLAVVGGRVPLLFEIKDQDGALGPDVGPLEAAAARAVADYDGPLAFMSFNPHSVAAIARLCPDRPWGLVTERFEPDEWTLVPEATLARLRTIPDFEPLSAGFSSHDAGDLDSPRVAEIRAAGGAILCWTIKSEDAEEQARLFADNVTFEGYLPHVPAT